MPHIKPDIETFARVKIAGVGGSGTNAISRMMKCKIEGVDLISINTDAQDLHHGKAHQKLRIGKDLTQGLGTGMNPELGRLAAEESSQEIQNTLKGADMVFITGGFGGGTCTGAAPVVAQIAKDIGALVVAIITKPFSFEGGQRMQIAEEGLTVLQDKVDTLITISNDKLLSIIDKEVSLLKAFWICDEVLRQAVQGISDLIVLPGIINIDFADVKAVMENSGSAVIGIGKARGKQRAQEAARLAINSSLIDASIDGAKRVFFNVSGGEDMTLSEVNEAAKIIVETIDPSAKVIFGAIKDGKLRKGEIKITVVATDFDKKLQKNLNLNLPQNGIRKEKKKIFPTNNFSQQEEKPEISAQEKEWEVPAFLRRKNKEKE